MKVEIVAQDVSHFEKKKKKVCFSPGYYITLLSLNLLAVQLPLIFVLLIVWLWPWWDQFSFQLFFLVL